MLIYAYSIQAEDTLDVGNQVVVCTMLANLRAFAGLSAGAFVFKVNSWLDPYGIHRIQRSDNGAVGAAFSCR